MKQMERVRRSGRLVGVVWNTQMRRLMLDYSVRQSARTAHSSVDDWTVRFELLTLVAHTVRAHLLRLVLSWLVIQSTS